MERIGNNNPSYKCPNDARIINTKAGMITADELVYGGGLYFSSVSN